MKKRMMGLLLSTVMISSLLTGCGEVLQIILQEAVPLRQVEARQRLFPN